MSDYKKYVEPSPKKIRRKYFPELHDEAVKILNAYFVNNRYPTKSDREHLVKYINDELKTNSEGMKQLIGVDHLFTISPREVDTWFQNRRNETSSPPPLDDLGESQWLSVSTPFVYRPPPFKSDKHRSHRENQKSKPESEDGVYQEWKKRLFSLPPPPRPISPASAPSEVDKLKKEIRKLKLDSTSTKSKQWKDIATMPVWTPSTSFRPPTSTSYGYEKKLHEMLLEEAARERERVDLQKSTRLPPPLLSPRPEQSWANIPMIWDVTATPTSSYVQPPPATMPHTPTSSYVQPRPKSLASPSFVYNNDEDYSTVAAVDRAVSKPRQPPARMPHRHSYVEPRPKPPPLLLPPTSTSTKPTSTRLPPATHIHSYAPRPSSTKTQYMLGPTPREIKIISDPDENKSEYNLKSIFNRKLFLPKNKICSCKCDSTLFAPEKCPLQTNITTLQLLLYNHHCLYRIHLVLHQTTITPKKTHISPPHQLQLLLYHHHCLYRLHLVLLHQTTITQPKKTHISPLTAIFLLDLYLVLKNNYQLSHNELYLLLYLHNRILKGSMSFLRR